MDVLIITSREYYSLGKKKYEKLNCDKIFEYIESLNKYNCREEAIFDFFGKEADDADFDDDVSVFWDEEINSSKNLKLLKREFGDKGVVYIMPCIPRYHYSFDSQEGLCHELNRKQNYIGSFIEVVLEDITRYKDKNNNILVVAHDMDLFNKNQVERFMRIEDLAEDETNKLALLISHGTIPIENIFGYKHAYEPSEWRVFPVITDKLSADVLPDNLFSLFLGKMKYTR